MNPKIFITLSFSCIIGSSPLIAATLIDDMEGYPLGNVRDTTASSVWNSNGSSFADIESQSGNQFFTFGWDDAGYRGAHRDLGGSSIAANATSTLFFEFRAEDDRIDHAIGLTDLATPNTTTAGFPSFRAAVVLRDDTTANDGLFNLVVGGTTLTSGLTTNTWYNLWMVVDNNTDTVDYYLNTGSGDATIGDKLNGSPVAFLNTTSNALDRFVASGSGAVGGVEHSVYIDDIHLASGVQLGNPPIPEPSTAMLGMLALGLTALRRRR